MPRRKLIEGEVGGGEEKKLQTPEKFFYPELLEEAKLVGTSEDYYALVYKITPDGTAFEGRTRADITWEEFRDTFGTGKFQFQVKHRATNAYAGQNTFRIGGQINSGAGADGGLAGTDGGGVRGNEISALVRSLESLVKSLVTQKRSDVEEMLIKFAMNKLTEKQEQKTLSQQIDEIISLQRLLAPPKQKDTDLLEAFDKRLNLVERIEQIGKKVGAIDGEKKDDDFSVKDMVDVVKTLIENANITQTTMPTMPATTHLNGTNGNTITPEMKYQAWLNKFPSEFKKGADMVAKAMVAESSIEELVNALKAEASDETGKLKKDYEKFVKIIKVDKDIAIDYLKSQGFPVSKHLEWTHKALDLIAQTL